MISWQQWVTNVFAADVRQLEQRKQIKMCFTCTLAPECLRVCVFFFLLTHSQCKLILPFHCSTLLVPQLLRWTLKNSNLHTCGKPFQWPQTSCWWDQLLELVTPIKYFFLWVSCPIKLCTVTELTFTLNLLADSWWLWNWLCHHLKRHHSEGNTCVINKIQKTESQLFDSEQHQTTCTRISPRVL